MIARIINAKFLIHAKHSTRLFANCAVMLISFMLLWQSILNVQRIEGFYFCVLSSICHGFSQAFGEAIIMGYLKGLPSDLI